MPKKKNLSHDESEVLVNKKKSSIVCVACNTEYGAGDGRCPECGCGLVKIIPRDARRTHTIDQRQQGKL